MAIVDLPMIGTWSAWRKVARVLAQQGVPGAEIDWRFDGAQSLWGGEPSANPPKVYGELRVPKAFVDLASTAIWHSDPERFALLYDALVRLQNEKNLLEVHSDPLVNRLKDMAKAVRRDSHKMKAFVRFKDIGEAQGRRQFGAWFEPSHYPVEMTAPFFARRFGDMDWVIVTPDVTARFMAGALSLERTAARPADVKDATDDLWKTYFTNIFNPARLKVKAMTAEMPKKYWRNLPEAELIPQLIAQAQSRSEIMLNAPASEPNVRAMRFKARGAQPEPQVAEPDINDLDMAHKAIDRCSRCPLHSCATQAVWGEGPKDAAIMLVGEQPGDQEDLRGRPFVGPAGQLLDQAMAGARIDRSSAYLTNAVKHFKFQPRGKRRIHQKPNAGEIQACKFWLDLEINLVKPRLIVALGATAALSLTGDGSQILKRRGKIEVGQMDIPVLISIHPSSILRIPDASAAEQQRQALVTDLALAVARYQEEIPEST